MNYVKVIDGKPSIYSLGQLRLENPQISFPDEIPDGTLADYGVFPYTRPDIPIFDWYTEQVEDGEFKQDGDRKWVQPYVVTLLPRDTAELNVRMSRNKLLSSTDWMALSDVTMSAEWATYRQSLRDVTGQTGFPYGIVWPTKPE
jgi:hypothetical protein